MDRLHEPRTRSKIIGTFFAANSRLGVFLAVVALLICPPYAKTFAQNTFTSQSDAAEIEGIVRDSAGTPVADARVILLAQGDMKPVEAKTSSAGTFLFSVGQAGTYTIRTEKSGWQSAVLNSLVISAGEKKKVELVLQKLGSGSASTSSHPTTSSLEFNDEPNFTVAGVTDWSSLGLHGSDTTARTSEALAKDTLALKSINSETATPEAIEELKKSRDAVRKSLAQKDSPEGHHSLADLDERLGDSLEAVREYEQAARLDPSEQNYFDWGTELLLHRAAKPAEEVFAKGSSAHPKSARMLVGLGAAFYAAGSYDEAALRLCEASDRKPSDPTPYLFLGKMEQTISVLPPCSSQKLARFAEQQPENALANYYYSISLWKRARTSENAADTEKAKTLLKKAVTIDPKLDEAYLQLGNIFSARNSYADAINAYQKAIEANPHSADAHYRLSLAYKHVGEGARAEQEFQTYKQEQKTETIEIERQRRELRQFLIILKDQPAASSPQ
jgi:tetratricopeptide (TPR) repeat protein